MNLDYIVEEIINEKLDGKEIRDADKAKGLAKQLSGTLLRMACAIQGYDKDFKRLISDEQRKSDYKKESDKLKVIMNKAGPILKDETLYYFPEFRLSPIQWKKIIEISEHPEEYFDNPGTDKAKESAKTLANLTSEIRRRNWVRPAGLSSRAFAKDLSNTYEEMRKHEYILSKLEYNGPENERINNEFKNMEKRKTKEAELSEITRSKYIEALKGGRSADKKHSSGFRTNRLDGVRQEKVDSLNKEINLQEIKNAPIEYKGNKYTNVKDLAKAWDENKEPGSGQIKIISMFNTFNKPVLEINGKLYIVPRNDVISRARGGIAVSGGPYEKYVSKHQNDPKYEEIRRKIGN